MNKKEKNSKKTNKVIKIIFIFFIIIFICGIGYLTYYLCDRNNNKDNEGILNNIKIDESKITENKTERMLQLEELQKENKEIIGINILCKILNFISFGLLSAFTVCFKLKWINKHTIINRKRLAFDGRAISLFGKCMLWGFLTVITFGIFGLWVPIKKLK